MPRYESTGLNHNDFANWDVTNGTVDTIGEGYFDLYPGNGTYVDLDGSSGDAGKLSTKTAFALTNGVTYRLSYEIAGNSRGAGTDVLTVALGSLYSSTTNIADNLPPTPFSIDIVGDGGSHKISFEDAGADNQGVLLFEVTLLQLS